MVLFFLGLIFLDHGRTRKGEKLGDTRGPSYFLLFFFFFNLSPYKYLISLPIFLHYKIKIPLSLSSLSLYFSQN